MAGLVADVALKAGEFVEKEVVKGVESFAGEAVSNEVSGGSESESDGNDSQGNTDGAGTGAQG
ncbi:hypothetical protein H0H92_004061 [Tricholoma furcatifolium]|nr:hypothetical protein H0H92_004061 [Tricholoma furcatifolium]